MEGCPGFLGPGMSREMLTATAGAAGMGVTSSGTRSRHMHEQVAIYGDDSMGELPNEQQAENLRTEYEAICRNLNQLASFRFTLVGFYVAAIGLIGSGTAGHDKF